LIYDDPHTAWGEADYWGTYEPGTAYAYNVVSLRTDLVDVRTGKLIWWGTTQTTEQAGRIHQEIKGLASALITAMTKAGVLPPH
jgi:hypothetical protein